jgi:hypothetical protein
MVIGHRKSAYPSRRKKGTVPFSSLT